MQLKPAVRKRSKMSRSVSSRGSSTAGSGASLPLPATFRRTLAAASVGAHGETAARSSTHAGARSGTAGVLPPLASPRSSRTLLGDPLGAKKAAALAAAGAAQSAGESNRQRQRSRSKAPSRGRVARGGTFATVAPGAGAHVEHADLHAEAIEVVDAETGEVCVLNTKTAVERAAQRGDAPAPRIVSTAIHDALPPIVPVDEADKAARLQLLKRQHAAQLQALADREAAREGMREEVLARESIAWRRQEMQLAFNVERQQGREELNKLRLDQELELAAMMKAMRLIH